MKSDPPRRPQPNHALRQIREAADFTQAELADRVELSTPYIQAVEQGTRRANEKLALKLMAIFGVWHECILHHWTEAVDLYGKPYTRATWEQYIECQPETLSDLQAMEYAQPVTDLFRAAAKTGKIRVLALLLREYTKEIIDINGLGSAINQVLNERASRVTEFTFGELRSDALIAKALQFVDDPSRADDEIAWRAQSVMDKPLSLFPQIYPHPGEISKRYLSQTSLTSDQ